MRDAVRELLGTDVAVKVAPLPGPPSLELVERAHDRWRRDKGLTDKFVVMYAGNFGRMYNFEPMLKAAKALKAEKDIAFVFVGSGFYEKKINQSAHSMRLGNVHIMPPEPEERLSEMLCAADLHVVPLIAGAQRVMWPHKINSLVKLGLKVMAVGFDPMMDGVEVVEEDALGMRILDGSRGEGARKAQMAASAHAPEPKKNPQRTQLPGEK